MIHLHLPDVTREGEIRELLGAVADSLRQRQKFLVSRPIFQALWGEQAIKPLDRADLLPADFAWTGHSHDVRVLEELPVDLVIVRAAKD